MRNRQGNGLSKSGRYNSEDTARLKYIHYTSFPLIQKGLLSLAHDIHMLELGPLDTSSDQTNNRQTAGAYLRWICTKEGIFNWTWTNVKHVQQLWSLSDQYSKRTQKVLQLDVIVDSQGTTMPLHVQHIWIRIQPGSTAWTSSTLQAMTTLTTLAMLETLTVVSKMKTTCIPSTHTTTLCLVSH